MQIHQRQLEKILSPSFLISSLEHADLKRFIDRRSLDPGRNRKVTATTIKKGIVTLRTVWNWGKRNKLLVGDFPSKGLMYPKGRELQPFMPFQDIERIAKSLSPEQAKEYWERAFLSKSDISELLRHVRQTARHAFVYPLFVFACHTGARRSEIARAKITDVDFTQGFITLHERKKKHDTLTTRRVPMSAPLRRALKNWFKIHPDGDSLFRHFQTVVRSKKRSLTTGHMSKGRPSSGKLRAN